MKTTDYEHGAVPSDQRKGWFPIAAVWITIGIDLSGAYLGIELATGMDFWSAIAATAVGSLVLGLLAMASADVGAKTGFSTAMISRAVFGRIGGAVLALALSLSLLGWFAVQAGFLGTNAQIAFASLTGTELPLWIFTLIGGILMAGTALWGYRSISRLSVLAAPLLIVLLAVGIVVAVATRGTGELFASVDPLFTFGGAVSLVMGIFILGVVSAPDMARWAKSPKQAMAAGFVGFFFGNAIIIVVAIVLTRVVGASELMTIFFMLGLGVVAVVVLILAQWTTNTANIYSSALNFASISGRLDRRALTIGGSVIGIAIAVLGASDYFVPFISAIGIVISPFGGVYLAAFFVERNRAKFAVDAVQPTVRVPAIAAWVFGIAVALMTAVPTDGLGFGLFTLTTVSSIDGLLAGFVAYAAITLVTGRRRADPAPVSGEASSDAERVSA